MKAVRWLFLILAASSLFAQTGQITGRITDQAGAAVPATRITIRESAVGRDRVLQTNADGLYTASALQPGEYSITATHPGFKTVTKTGIQLQVDQDIRLDFPLELGSVTDKVEVSADAAVLETETQTEGQVVQGRQIVELPLLGRNPYALGELVPGVRVARGMNDLPVDQISTSSVSINGARGNANEYLLDGAPNTAAAQNQPIIYANADSVQEFKVETSTFSAEYGRAAGGVFNVVTKSGTNSFHFTLYEFFRNDKLNSNDWFANRAGQKPPPFKFNQFGGVLGGPVWRNKTFFFVSTELARFIQGNTYIATVPNPVLLTGDFGHDLNSAGKLITIYDPLSTRPNPAGAGFVRTAFPDNIIPPGRINPVARKLAGFFPTPNTAGAPFTGTNNYVRTDANRVQKNTWSARLDHNFTEATRVFARFSYDDTPIARASPYGFADPGSPAFGPQTFTRYNTVSEATHIFTPTLIGVLRASFSRLSNFRNPIGLGFDIGSLGFPAALASQIGFPAAFPAVNITGYSVASSIPNSSRTGALGETGVIAFGMNNYAVQGNLTRTFGGHVLKFGGEFRVIRFNTLQTDDASTQFNFTSAFTQGPNPTTPTAATGDALAAFLLGIPGGSVTPSPAVALQSLYYGAFVQDQWHVTNKLTLNLGLRYEIETPRTERFNQLTNFNSQTVPPLNAPGLNLHGALAFVNTGGLPRTQSEYDGNNFAPRVGVAWHVTPKTVVRSGFGISYGTNFGIGGAPSGFGVSGFDTVTSINTSNDGVTPIVYLDNPYPNGLNRASGSSRGAATQLGQSVTFYDRRNLTPYALQWNFDVQRELLFGWVLDTAYVGTRGLKFPANLVLNQLPDSALSLGDALRTQVPNPFFGQIAIGSLSGRTISRAQLLRPYPQFDSVTSAAATWAPSNYHALEVKLEKRFAKGFTFLASYTYSKTMDYSTGPFNGESLGGGGVQDNNNTRADYSTSSLDQTQRLIANTVYALPFFRTQQGIVGHVLGGWEAGIVASFYSGSPLGVTSAVNNTFSQGGAQRPNWNGQNPALSRPSPSQWLNPSVFSVPAPYTFGNAPRTFNGVRSDRTNNVDLSLHKNTHITERLQLQFRAESFNLTNTPVFAPPNTTFGSPAFGTVSSQANQPRVLQLALKLLY